MAQTVIDWSQPYATWVAGDGAVLGNFNVSGTTPNPATWGNLVASYIAADYDLTHRGTARTVKGRASNSTGVIADIAGAGSGTVLHDNGTSLAFRSVTSALDGTATRLLTRTATPVTITDSVTVTDLLAYTIPGGTVTAGRLLRVRMGGTYLNNSGASRTPTWEVELGGTTLFQDAAIGNGASALVTCWNLEFTLAAESATVVHVSGNMRQSPTNAPDTGLGALDNTIRMDMPFSTVAAGVTVSSLASDRLLSVNFNHPVATSTQTLVRTWHSVELL